MARSEFLSFLVEETLKLQQSGEGELSSLELKLKDYDLAFLKGSFIPQTQLLRFETSFGVLDFPSNWSIFTLEGGAKDHSLLFSEHDPDCLFSVLQHAWEPALDRVLFTHADGFCYLVGLKAGEDVHLHDLLSPQEWLRTA